MSRRSKKDKPKSTIRSVISLGVQAGAAVTVVRALQEARGKGDKLEIFDAVAHAAVIASTVALLIRGLNRGKSTPDTDAEAVPDAG